MGSTVPEQKSISVAKVRDIANRMLLSTPPGEEEQRIGVWKLLEAVLREANAYHGYGEFALDNTDPGEHGLRRQYYRSPTEGTTLVRFHFEDPDALPLPHG